MSDNISKSTPYKRYEEIVQSDPVKGYLYNDSEYLDETRDAYLESVEGKAYVNRVNNASKEEAILSEFQAEFEGGREYHLDVDKRIPIDEIRVKGEVVPDADGNYNYTVSTMEGEYIEVYDGINNIISTSDGLDGNFEITYGTNEEDTTGTIALDAVAPTYTIEDSGVGTITGAKSTGLTLVNNITEPSKDEVVAIGEYEGQYFTIENTVQGNFKSAILKGNTIRKIGLEIGSYNGYLDKIPMNNRLRTTETVKGYNTIRIDCKDGYQAFIRAVGKDSSWNQSLSFTLESESESSFVVLFRKNDESVFSQSDYGNIIEYTNIAEISDNNGNELVSVKMPVLTTTGKNLFSGNIIENSITKIVVLENIECISTLPMNSLNSIVEFEHPIKLDDDIVISFVAKVPSYLKINPIFEDDTFGSEIGTWNSVNTWTKLSFRVPSNSKKIKGFTCIASSAGIKAYIQKETVQIEQGTQDTSYEPYKTNILTTSEEVELRRIGEVQDTLDCLTGEVTQRVGEIVLDGSENWSRFSENRFHLKIDNWKLASTITTNAKADKINVVPYSQYQSSSLPNISRYNGDDYGIFLYTGGSGWCEDDVTSLKTKLQSNPITVQYELTTGSIKTVDLTVQNQDGNTIPHIQTQQGITHVSTSSDGLTPVVEMSCSYDTIIKPNTTYTIKLDRPNVSDTMNLQVDLGGTMMMLDADVNAFTIKTPSTLSHSQLRLSGVGNTVKEIIVLEGNRVNDKIEYFEGMKNVENPILVVSNCPYVFGKGGRL